MNKKFFLEICSDLDYEEMVADVSYENQYLAIITQENGVDHMEIEISSLPEGRTWKLPLDEFIETLVGAKNRLINMSKNIE